MKKVDAELWYALMINCPHCDHRIDLVEEVVDDEGMLSYPLFNNKWEDIDADFDCPECEKEFTVGNITY